MLSEARAGWRVPLERRGADEGERFARGRVRELQGGTSSVTFSYNIVARRKDIKRHRRFAKLDARLPVVSTRTPRQSAPTPRALRAFVASLEKEARSRRPKGAKKTRS